MPDTLGVDGLYAWADAMTTAAGFTQEAPELTFEQAKAINNVLRTLTDECRILALWKVTDGALPTAVEFTDDQAKQDALDFAKSALKALPGDLDRHTDCPDDWRFAATR